MADKSELIAMRDAWSAHPEMREVIDLALEALAAREAKEGEFVVEGWMHPNVMEARVVGTGPLTLLSPWISYYDGPTIVDIVDKRDQTHFQPVTVTIRKRQGGAQ